MKSFLIIGMGTLGHHLFWELNKRNCEIMVADIDASALEDVVHQAVSSRVGDCKNIEMLKTLGVEDFDACFVCLNDYFLDCLEITDLLKELGAKKVYSAANRSIEEKFLLKSGADRIIFPERDIARRIAGIESAQNIFDFISLSDEYSIFEIEPNPKWIGKTVLELDFRNRYKLNIIAIKADDEVNPIFRNDYVFKPDEHLLVLGHADDLKAAMK